jgi:DNA replication and repair protein RecF
VALASIGLRGFRNLDPTTVESDRGTNWLLGPNGSGKTNLPEAIHCLAIGRSFRRCPDTESLGFGKDGLVVA